MANKACFAFYNLAADRVGEDYSAHTQAQGGNTSYMSPFFPTVVEKLLLIAERPDGGECNLRGVGVCVCVCMCVCVYV